MLKRYVGQLIDGVKASSLFPVKPMFLFYPEVDCCPDCGAKLHVQKSWEKTVVTLDIGAFRAKETVFQCPNDKAVFGSPPLRALVPTKCAYGFDVIVEIGMLLFVHSRNEKEIVSELAARNIFISERAVGYLGRKFVVYLALAHRENRQQLLGAMAKRGGYILHVDGTCEGDSPHLFCGIDGISEIVLDSIKIPSEKKELLIPFLQRIKDQFGDPAALVHDMGLGILAAVAEVFPGAADFICHFHFLRDVGKDLLLEDYQTIIKRLRQYNVRGLLKQKARYLERKMGQCPGAIGDLKRSLGNDELNAASVEHMPAAAAYALIHWAFESSSESKGYGFPFDRPHLDFYQRLKMIQALLENIIDIRLREAKDNRSFLQVKKLLDQVLSDGQLKDAVADIEAKARVFDKLREALRIALPEGKKGLNDDGGEEPDIRTIEKKATEFRGWLVGSEKRKHTYRKMIEQMDKYWEKLFADPLVINTPEGQSTITPQRTNNLLERFFRGEKRRGRKKSGTASLNKTLKSILAETPLVRNLNSEEYLGIMLNGCSTLAERFSHIDAEIVQEELRKAESNQEKISKEARWVIKQPDLPERISVLFGVASKINANCHLRS
jgi:hypothetical protein